MDPERYISTYRYRVSDYEEDAIINATYFAWFLMRAPYNWSINAICAALGNWEVETYLNPNYPQYTTFPVNTGGGFGMPHWTPWGDRIGKWAFDTYGLTPSADDDNPLADFALQMEYHEHECVYGDGEGGKYWYANEGYSYTWKEWKRSTDGVEELAAAYYWQYERSGAGNPGDRPERARKWFDYFELNPPPKYVPIWLLFKAKEVMLWQQRARRSRSRF